MPGVVRRRTAASSATESNDQAFTAVAHQYLEDLYRRQPTQATYLGIHKYDDQLEDYSRQAVTEAVAAARAFRDRVSAIDPATLSPDNQLDREQLLHAIDSRLLTLEVVRPWAKGSRHLQQRPDEHRLHHDQARRSRRPRSGCGSSIAREKAMPAALAEARKNLDNPPRIYTQIAIEQIDGNRELLQDGGRRRRSRR